MSKLDFDFLNFRLFDMNQNNGSEKPNMRH